MLMWLKATEDSRTEAPSLKKEINDAVRRIKHVTHRRENISEKKRWKRCLLDGKNRAHLDCCTCVGVGWGGWGSCFVASDWLKKQGIKASHVLSIHYPKRKIHLGRDLAGRSLFSILFLHILYKKNILSSEKKNIRKREEIILSVCHTLKSSVCNLAALSHQTIIPLGGTPFCGTPDA